MSACQEAPEEEHSSSGRDSVPPPSRSPTPPEATPEVEHEDAAATALTRDDSAAALCQEISWPKANVTDVTDEWPGPYEQVALKSFWSKYVRKAGFADHACRVLVSCCFASICFWVCFVVLPSLSLCVYCILRVFPLS